MRFSFKEYFSFCTRFLKKNNCYIEFIEELRNRKDYLHDVGILCEPTILNYTRKLYNEGFCCYFINNAFCWNDSKSGYHYWSNLDKLFTDKITPFYWSKL